MNNVVGRKTGAVTDYKYSKALASFEKEWTFKHKYDNIGNLIEFIGYVNDIHEEKLKWEYKYDEKNNWIERLEYKYNRNSSYYKPSTITERKIQYYLK